MSLEQNFAEIEVIIQKLEAEDISLADSFAAYHEGMKLLKQCNEAIDKVEKQVLQISGSGEVVPFEG